MKCQDKWHNIVNAEDNSDEMWHIWTLMILKPRISGETDDILKSHKAHTHDIVTMMEGSKSWWENTSSVTIYRRMVSLNEYTGSSKK